MLVMVYLNFIEGRMYNRHTIRQESVDSWLLSSATLGSYSTAKGLRNLQTLLSGFSSRSKRYVYILLSLVSRTNREVVLTGLLGTAAGESSYVRTTNSSARSDKRRV